MEVVTLSLAAIAGFLASLIGLSLKKWLSVRSKATEFEVKGPTGEKMKISVEVGQNLEPTEIKRQLLRTMLEDPKFSFGRTFETLKKGIASTDEETKNLLFQIGARPNLKSEGKETWTLRPITGNVDSGVPGSIA